MSVFTLKVNGQSHTVDVDPTTPLLYVLSDDLALKGPKFGCGLGQCGSCTAIVNGRAVRSCRTPVSTVNGADIVTLEGLGSPEKPHPIQKAFIDEQAAQCGYCTNGMIMQAASLLATNPAPTEAEIRTGMANNLCRCGTHLAVIRAIQSASA
jgi:nicotinate dehydrogenase subunit A